MFTKIGYWLEISNNYADLICNNTELHEMDLMRFILFLFWV